jgi:CMP-N,N'-diacetyllegionaminic acid synthase
VAWKGQTVLAVIPARAGSKGIPRKNLREIGGRSLIAHTARCALALDWIDQSVLSTDDAEMADEGRRCGLEVPFMRPAELATDTATGPDTWRHAWQSSESHYGRRFDLGILLQPTTPLRSPDDVERTIRALLEGGHRAAATVARVPAHFTPEKLLVMDDSTRLHFYSEQGTSHTRRQTIPPYYFRDGTCYAVTRDTLMKGGSIIEDDCVGVLIDHPVVNIDEPFELELARLLYERRAAGRREE